MELILIIIQLIVFAAALYNIGAIYTLPGNPTSRKIITVVSVIILGIMPCLAKLMGVN